MSDRSSAPETDPGCGRPLRAWTSADATRVLHCERCGASFGCTANGEAGSCWCSETGFRLPSPLPADVGPYADCLCPACLAAVADELRAAGRGPR